MFSYDQVAHNDVVDFIIHTTHPGENVHSFEKMICTDTSTVSPRHYINIGSAVGKPLGNLSQLMVSEPNRYCGATPEILLENRFTYIVTNTGNVALSEIVVSDGQIDLVFCPNNQLGVGEQMICIGYTFVREGAQVHQMQVEFFSPTRGRITAEGLAYYTGKSKGSWIFLSSVVR